MSLHVKLLAMGPPLLCFMFIVVPVMSIPFIFVFLGKYMMRRRGVKRVRSLVLIAAGVLSALILIQFFPLLKYVFDVSQYGSSQIQHLDHAIKHDLPEIAAACLSLRQHVTNDNDMVLIDRGDARLPDIIFRTNCRYAVIQPFYVKLEMHGGFDHFGIRLEQDQSDTNVWQVLRYWEGGDEHLMTITNEVGASNQAVLPIAAGADQADR